MTIKKRLARSNIAMFVIPVLVAAVLLLIGLGIGFTLLERVYLPQLGISLRVFSYHCDGDTGHLVNPVVEVVGDEMQDGPEGCLSIPGMYWDCRRHLRVVARGFNQHGEPIEVAGSERLARAIQHETDHLDGVLFIDRLDSETRRQAMREIRQAHWFGAAVPVVKLSPHPLLGKVR